MKIFKYSFLILAMTLFSFNSYAQGEKDALLEILDGLTIDEKLKILEYAKSQKKSVDEQIIAIMNELPNNRKALVVEYALTLKDATMAASNGSDVVREREHDHAKDAKKASAMELTSMKFDKATIQFGRVREGKVVERTFRFQNTGNKPLTILSAKGSCGCTVPRVPQKPIPPKGYGTIVVKFNTTKKVGKRTQSVTIVSNTEPKVSQIYLQGEVLQDE